MKALAAVTVVLAIFAAPALRAQTTAPTPDDMTRNNPLFAEALNSGWLTQLAFRCGGIQMEESVQGLVSFNARVAPLPPSISRWLADEYSRGQAEAAAAFTRDRTRSCRSFTPESRERVLALVKDGADPLVWRR